MKISAGEVQNAIQESISVKEKLCEEKYISKVLEISTTIIKSLKNGGKLLICGNGGSAADAQHTAAELINRYKVNRRPIAAIALTTDTSILTSIANDFDYTQVFKKQVEALGRKDDVLLAISTSGKAKSILEAVLSAQKLGLITIGLTGQGPNPLSQSSNLCLEIPSQEVARIQESHLLIIHIICDFIEKQFLD